MALLFVLSLALGAAVAVYAWFKLSAQAKATRLIRPLVSEERIGRLPCEFPFGNLAYFTRSNPIDVAEAMHSIRGNFSLVSGFLFNEPRAWIIGPESAKEIFSVSDREYIRPPSPVALFRRIVGKSILGASGEDWQRQHRLLYKKNLRQFISIMVEETEIMMEKFESGPTINVGRTMEGLALRITVRAAFAFDSGDDTRIDAIIQALLVIQQFQSNLLHVFEPLNRIPTPENNLINGAYESINSIADSIVQVRRQALQAGKISADKCYLVDLLIQAHDDESGLSFSDAELRDNIIIFLVAGSETTAWSMTWFLYNMVKSPHVYEKLLPEIDVFNALEEQYNAGFEKQHLPYFSQCLNESLRAVPPVVATFARVLTEPRVVDNVRLEKGVKIMASITSMHHNEDVWGPNTREYNPDHFSPAESAKRHPCAFMPFGTGRRLCIGRNFAYEEMNVVLPLLLHRFTFTMPPNHPPVEPRMFGPVIHMKEGLQLRFTPRKEA